MSYHQKAKIADGAGAATITCPPARMAAAIVDIGVAVINDGRLLATGPTYFTNDTEPWVSGTIEFTGGTASATHAVGLHY